MKPQTDMRDIIIIAVIVFFVLLTVFLVTSYAQAQTAPTYRSEYNPVSRGHWEDDDHPGLRRYVRHERHRHTRKIWRHHDHGHRPHHEGRHCQPTIAVVGDQYATEEGAKQESDKAWMQTARWQFGERYMSRENADDATYECGRSSVGSVAGQVFFRCRLKARPCKPEPQGANK
jgi:Ni/Co efflux regulator RcnB